MLSNRIIVSRKLARDGASAWAITAVRSSGRTSEPTEAAAATVPLVGGTSSGEVIQPLKRGTTKLQKISRAMQVYLERAKKHEDFLRRQSAEFDMGKRHLANMMGWDPDNITQEEIDRAIAYLLPSGLYEPRARPMMKPPERIFPQEKAAQFDATGRPFHYLFYTGKPNFYAALHDAVSQLSNINKQYAHLNRSEHKYSSEKGQIDLTGTQWVSKEELERMFVEELDDEQYDYFVRTLTRLAEHPYSMKAEAFITRFRKQQISNLSSAAIKPLSHDANGNPYAVANGGRKTCLAQVIVHGNGTGRFVLNNCITPQEYFAELKDRIQIMFPLQFTGLLNKVDIEAIIYNRDDEYATGLRAQLKGAELQELQRPLLLNQGKSSEAGAIRHAISRALCSFVSKEDVELMRLAGLLTRDPRSRERKKPGKEGARRSYTWLKR